MIEDTPNGVSAAKKAGMQCVAITTTNDAETLGGADFIINGFEAMTVEYLWRHVNKQLV